MRDQPDKPYVYQPFESVEPSERTAFGRLYGVGHPSPLVEIRGLTRYEAETVCEVMRNLQGAPHG